MSKGTGESGTNNLLDQQIWASFQRLLLWHSGDKDGLQSQRSEVQIQVGGKCMGSLGLGIVIGLEFGGQ